MTFIIIATLHLGVGVGVDQAPARMGNLKKKSHASFSSKFFILHLLLAQELS